MQVTFDYILAQDIILKIECHYKSEYGDVVLDDITASQEGGTDIFTELKDLYIREFGSVNIISVADHILKQASELEGAVH
jgi:hypothetical protein